VPTSLDLHFQRVASGPVKSLDRPGGNVTGAAFFTQPLATKRLELPRELMPSLKTIAVLVNPNNAPTVLEGTNAEAAAQAFGWRSEILHASVENHIDDAFSIIVEKRISALFVDPKASLLHRRIKPLRQRPSLKSDPGEPKPERTEPVDQRLRFARHLGFPDDLAVRVDNAHVRAFQ
jgi:hypothetical protein